MTATTVVMPPPPRWAWLSPQPARNRAAAPAPARAPMLFSASRRFPRPAYHVVEIARSWVLPRGGSALRAPAPRPGRNYRNVLSPGRRREVSRAAPPGVGGDAARNE